MSECILFYTKLHCDESLALSEGIEEGGRGLEGVLPHSLIQCPMRGYAAGRVWFLTSLS